jgi:hypothetical protein
MGMLKLSTINLDAGASIAEQRSRHDFYDSGFAGAGRSQKQQISHGASRRIEASQERLVDLHHVFYGLILTDNFPVQGIRKFSRVFAMTRGIQRGG